MDTETDEQRCHYKITRRGYRTLIYSGYNYMRNRQRGNKEYWVCSLRPRCLGKAVTVDGLITQLSGGHNHPPSSGGYFKTEHGASESKHSVRLIGRMKPKQMCATESSTDFPLSIKIENMNENGSPIFYEEDKKLDFFSVDRTDHIPCVSWEENEHDKLEQSEHGSPSGLSNGFEKNNPGLPLSINDKNMDENRSEIFYQEGKKLEFSSMDNTDHISCVSLAENENDNPQLSEQDSPSGLENSENHLNLVSESDISNENNLCENKNSEIDTEPIYHDHAHINGMYFNGHNWNPENPASKFFRPGRRHEPYPVLMNVRKSRIVRQSAKAEYSNRSNNCTNPRRTTNFQRNIRGNSRDYFHHNRRGRGQLSNQINSANSNRAVDTSEKEPLFFEEYHPSSSADICESCHCCCHRYNRYNPDSRSPSVMSNLQLTKPAPEWKGTAVVNNEFKDISLADYKDKYLVFFFYPLDFTFVCPTEIIAFSDRVEEFRAINCEVVACSTDSHFSHLAWVNTPRKQGGLGNMKIPLLADKTSEISKAYGVLKEDEGIAFRGLFIIDGKGNLRQITVNDLPVGRSVDETLRLVQAFQFTDKNGEVCPAGWKPGSDTMKPDTKGSKTFFQKHN